MFQTQKAAKWPHLHATWQGSASVIWTPKTPDPVVREGHPMIVTFTNKKWIFHLLPRAIIIWKCPSTANTDGKVYCLASMAVEALCAVIVASVIDVVVILCFIDPTFTIFLYYSNIKPRHYFNCESVREITFRPAQYESTLNRKHCDQRWLDYLHLECVVASPSYFLQITGTEYIWWLTHKANFRY